MIERSSACADDRSACPPRLRFFEAIWSMSALVVHDDGWQRCLASALRTACTTMKTTAHRQTMEQIHERDQLIGAAIDRSRIAEKLHGAFFLSGAAPNSIPHYRPSNVRRPRRCRSRGANEWRRSRRLQQRMERHWRGRLAGRVEHRRCPPAVVCLTGCFRTALSTCAPRAAAFAATGESRASAPSNPAGRARLLGGDEHLRMDAIDKGPTPTPAPWRVDRCRGRRDEGFLPRTPRGRA